MRITTKLFWLRKVALTLAIILVTETCLPTITWALTSGPSKPEIQSFEPITTTEMVDMFSGDFTYNIPLFELPGPNGGYPFNLHYNAGITMDQEASWVGLGWNLNPGAINREMQGLPDEYKNALVESTLDIEPSETYSVSPGAGIEIFGEDMEKISSDLTLNLGTTVKYNNYKGFGYSLDVGIDFGKDFGNVVTSGVGLNLSLDSESGIGVNLSPSLSIADSDNSHRTSFQIGVGYNSREGLNSYSFTASRTRYEYKGPLLAKVWEKKNYQAQSSQSGTSAISIMSGGYIPPVSNPMQIRYGSANFKAGVSAFGVYGNVSLTGFYSKQYLDAITKNHLAYGYLYSEYDDGKAMLDFNREKDGMLHKKSPNLPAPITTPDIFTMTSHGMATMFRAFRNDAGAYHDVEMAGQNVGGSGGLEIGSHFGVDATFGYGETRVSKWDKTKDNSAADTYAFIKTEGTTSGQESYYFKTYGEPTSTHKNTYDNIGGEEPVALKLDAIVEKNRNLSSSLVKRDRTPVGNPSTNYAINTTNRAARNTPVQYIDPEFPDKGMYSINSDGTMYVFGRKQMVVSNSECIYSIEQDYKNGGTVTNNFIPEIAVNGIIPNQTIKYKEINDKIEYYYSKKKLNNYPYSYLITEIRGADYVDSDGSGTVTDGDKGYWVKFHYGNQSTNYKWRAPYYGANFIPGKRTTVNDNKATFTYGEKQVSYLDSVETNSHVAIFSVSKRKDGRGAFAEAATQGSAISIPDQCDYSYKLDNITLQSKKNRTKNLMKVKFEYAYELCKGVINNDGKPDPSIVGTNSGGKLTLKKVWIEYENNTRGKMNPYSFDYHANNPAENPNYITNNYDRWGYNRSALSTVNADNPYVPQFDRADPNFKANTDIVKAAWSLKALTLPSGAVINVEYEADDYAYVQNVRAGQMFKIYGLSTAPTQLNTIAPASGNIASDYSGANQRRIIFELEKPIQKTATAMDTLKMQYTEGLTEVYFKIYGNLMASENSKDYVSGYAKAYEVGFEPTLPGETEYKRAYIVLSAPQIGAKTFNKYHPFSVAFWQTLMTDYSEMLFSKKMNMSENESKSERRAKLADLGGMVGEIQRMFKGFYSYANDPLQNWGKSIDLDRSFIRLHAPDKIKIGGGIRVKKITLSDQWNKMHPNATESVYGQVYDYTTKDGRGLTISSGVATYEPMTGGDENPLRNAKQFVDRIPLKLDNNVFFETPVNESYYPGASVGYSKVTVKSLASYQNEQRKAGMPAGILTTGAVCHEFYTCKEFPIINTETEIINIKDPYVTPIPLIGTVTDIRVTASQGYAIQLNDMHGKPKKTSTYAQANNGTILYTSPVSYIEYKYKANQFQTGTGVQDNYCILNNKVPVLIKNAAGDLVQSNNYMVGEQIEFFTDMREQVSNNTVSGVNINTDIVTLGPFPIPVPAVWPSMNYNRTRVRTVVTNKIIHKFGLIDSIIAYNGGSTVKTKNLVFDGVTGEAILTSVTNNFDDKVYSFNMPGHLAYSGLSSAYKSVGTRINGNLSSPITDGSLQGRNKERIISVTSGSPSLVSQGDILTFYPAVGANITYSGIVTHASGNTIYIQTSPTTPALTGARFYISYPGSRNQLSSKVGSVSTLESPSLAGPSNPLDQLYPVEP